MQVADHLEMTSTYLATERAEEAHDVVVFVVGGDGVDLGVVLEARRAEHVTTRQSLGPVVRQLTDPAHHQIRARLRRRLTIRHH